MVKVKDLVIGEGMPKICVPIVEKTQEDILEQAQKIVSESADLVEWRMDFYEKSEQVESVIQTADLLQSILGKTPLLLTFRTAKEGGEKEISIDAYETLLKAIALSGKADMIDVEVFFGYDKAEEKRSFSVSDCENEAMRSLIKELSKSVCVIGSYHDFDKTPSVEEMVKRLLFMEQMGVDIPKMAVMPKERKDVLNLMQATLQAKEQIVTKPLITMSMGALGKISRIAGNHFASDVTFGCLGKASAPGQVTITELRQILQMISFE